MKGKKTIQKYIKNFRRRQSFHSKPGIVLACDIHPSKEEEAILEFFHGPGIEKAIDIKKHAQEFSAALSSVPKML